MPARASAGDQWVFRAPAARPTDHPDPNRNAYTVPEAPHSPACTRHFCVHWVAEGIDAPDPSRQQRRRRARLRRAGAGGRRTRLLDRERQARLARAQVRRPQGWRATARPTSTWTRSAAPSSATRRPTAARRRRRTGCRATCTATSSSTTTTTRSEFPGTTPEHDLEVTVAHEYNHILQFGYDAYQDAWFAESSAVWMEDEVYNGINDYLRYVRRWVKRFDTPLTANSIKEYGSAVWNKWLAHRYGRAIVRRGLGPRGAHQTGWLLGRRLQLGDRSGRRLGLQPRLRPLRPRPARVAHRHGLPARATPTPTSPARAACRSTAASSIAASTTPPSSCCAFTPAAAGRSSSARAAPRGIAAGLALVGRIGSERHGHVVSDARLQAERRPDDGAPGSTRVASSASPRCWSTPTRAPRASAPAGSTGPT